MQVLVVEDDAAIRETLALVLEAFSFGADLVADGKQALEFLKGSWPDVVLLDLSLPDMTGEELYHTILRRFGRAPPTVVISAAQEGESRTKTLPGTYYLAKPYSIEQLRDIIHAAARAVA